METAPPRLLSFTAVQPLNVVSLISIPLSPVSVATIAAPPRALPETLLKLQFSIVMAVSLASLEEVARAVARVRPMGI